MDLEGTGRTREWNGKHKGFLTAATEMLERLAVAAGQHIDRSATRRALLDALDAWPGDDDDRWWKWLVEAGTGLGLRIRPLDCSLQQALDLVQFGAVAATWLPGAAPTGLIITEVTPRKVRVVFPPEDNRRQLLRRGDLSRRLEAAGLSDPIRWVLVEPVVLGSFQHGDDHDGAKSPLSRLHTLLRPEWPDIWVVLVFALFVGLLVLATPIAVEALVNTVAFGQLLQPVVILSLMLFVFLAFASAMRGVQTYVVELIQRRLFARVAGELAWRLPRVHQGVWDRAYGPELVNRFFEVVAVQKTASALLLDGVTLVVGSVIGMAVLAFYHPWLLGFDLLLLALIVFTVFVLGRGAVATSIKESKTKYYLAGWLEELARCPGAFKVDGGAEFAAERADLLVADYLTARGRHFRILMRQIAFALFLQALASTVLLGLGGWLVIKGQLTLGQLVAAEMIVTIIVGAFAKLGKHFDAFYDLLASVDKLGHLFDLPLERQDGLMHVDASGPAAVRIHGVSYHYPEHAPILRDLTVEFKPGVCLGISGPPGSGKSTLIDILYGTRTPDAGHVDLDGTDLRDLRPDVLRQHVGSARQVEIFHGTLAENVHVHRPGVTTAEVRQALERVGLLEEVLALPQGLQTELHSNGSPLSGSQMRRLMLARALAGHPRLLLVDGLLDGLSDGEIESLLPRLQSDAGCTIVIVSGRRRILDWCDSVLEFPVESERDRHASHAAEME